MRHFNPKPFEFLFEMSVFAYDDSGAPEGIVIYTTLVILHGTGFNKSPSYLPLLVFSSSRTTLLSQIFSRTCFRWGLNTIYASSP